MLIPALKKEGYLGIRQYREAYDILCHLTPADESEIKNPQIRVEWVKPVEGYENEEPYINVYNCEGDLWAMSPRRWLLLMTATSARRKC
uniref:hypothetical protein n=1 Tax=Prevotella sp. TaxID=59823 RepID=UPI004029C76D